MENKLIQSIAEAMYPSPVKDSFDLMTDYFDVLADTSDARSVITNLLTALEPFIPKAYVIHPYELLLNQLKNKEK